MLTILEKLHIELYEDSWLWVYLPTDVDIYQRPPDMKCLLDPPPSPSGVFQQPYIFAVDNI